MAILLIGGTGKTARRLARLLQEAQISILIASRRAEESGASSPGTDVVRFDWLDPSTYENPFKNARITAAYIMNPIVENPDISMKAWIDYAIQNHGLRRFVLVAGTTASPGSPGVGGVWQHFLDTGVDYCVLRPTWFMENLTDGPACRTIKTEGKIYSATGDAQFPFVSAEDIAAVALRALTDPRSHNCDYKLLGRELLTYDQVIIPPFPRPLLFLSSVPVAAKLSQALGRRVEHVKLTADERVQAFLKAGLSDYYANFLVNVETKKEDLGRFLHEDAIRKVTGKTPKTFDEFIQENKAIWEEAQRL
ncbi:hypothetical protein N7462_009395 [Penicillium macrosclerotiorum]|uniref:uncharacterized protein n=1 Tax=Penicillium macrosclerotiorum TaxID=303699 RepID=UPI002546FAAD|nr:uncharacterized protein N7462_009395 [Penicillium macrosclerotiorum]KAJ5673956.1 hypothetical protein N7462_009395 [Penicillium macrosclerotiorum]